jgi:hypothetical protein
MVKIKPLLFDVRYIIQNNYPHHIAQAIVIYREKSQHLKITININELQD